MDNWNENPVNLRGHLRCALCTARDKECVVYVGQEACTSCDRRTRCVFSRTLTRTMRIRGMSWEELTDKNPRIPSPNPPQGFFPEPTPNPLQGFPEPTPNPLQDSGLFETPGFLQNMELDLNPMGQDFDGFEIQRNLGSIERENDEEDQLFMPPVGSSRMEGLRTNARSSPAPSPPTPNTMGVNRTEITGTIRTGRNNARVRSLRGGDARLRKLRRK